LQSCFPVLTLFLRFDFSKLEAKAKALALAKVKADAEAAKSQAEAIAAAEVLAKAQAKDRWVRLSRLANFIWFYSYKMDISSARSDQSVGFYGYPSSKFRFTGLLTKRGHMRKSWKSRMFALSHDGTLVCFLHLPSLITDCPMPSPTTKSARSQARKI
jgi:hypothetical protein